MKLSRSFSVNEEEKSRGPATVDAEIWWRKRARVQLGQGGRVASNPTLVVGRADVINRGMLGITREGLGVGGVDPREEPRAGDPGCRHLGDTSATGGRDPHNTGGGDANNTEGGYGPDPGGGDTDNT